MYWKCRLQINANFSQPLNSSKQHSTHLTPHEISTGFEWQWPFRAWCFVLNPSTIDAKIVETGLWIYFEAYTLSGDRLICKIRVQWYSRILPRDAGCSFCRENWKCWVEITSIQDQPFIPRIENSVVCALQLLWFRYTLIHELSKTVYIHQNITTQFINYQRQCQIPRFELVAMSDAGWNST